MLKHLYIVFAWHNLGSIFILLLLLLLLQAKALLTVEGDGAFSTVYGQWVLTIDAPFVVN